MLHCQLWHESNTLVSFCHLQESSTDAMHDDRRAGETREAGKTIPIDMSGAHSYNSAMNDVHVQTREGSAASAEAQYVSTSEGSAASVEDQALPTRPCQE